MNKTKALYLFITFLAALLFGCETSEDTTAPPIDQPTELSGTLGATGGTLISSDGRLSLTIPPGALAAETNLSLREIETADVDPAFGDFSIHAALEMEPANLALSAPAEISFSFSARQVADAVVKADGPQEYPFLLGIVMTAEGNIVPDQDITYDLDPTADNNFTITVESMAWSQLVVGNPADPSGKDNDFPKLTLEVEFKLDDEEIVPLVEDQASRFELFVILRGGGGLTLENPLMGSLPGQWDFYSLLLAGDHWEPEEVEETPDNRLRYRWGCNLFPGLSGQTRFSVAVDADLNMADITEMHLPVPEDAIPGQTRLHLRAKPVLIHVREPDPAPPSFSIATGMTAPKGLGVSFESFWDPAPLGTATDPWLYVTALEGLKYYRLVKNQNHAIVSTELVGTIILEGLTGALPISGLGEPNQRCLFMYEDGGNNNTTYWNPAVGEYGAIGVHFGSNIDAIAYGNINLSPGFSITQRTRVEFLEFNAVTGRFEGPPSLVGIMFTNSFPGLTGDIMSCIVHDATRAMLLVTGTGQIWYHARQDIEVYGVVVGSTGSAPRKIRGVGNFHAVSNANSSTLTTFMWGGAAVISNVQNTSVDAGPHGIDVRRLPNGSYLVVSTSAINNTYTLSHFDATGSHVRNVTLNAPATGLAPKYAIFVGLSSVPYVALSCLDSDTVEVIPVNLVDFN